MQEPPASTLELQVVMPVYNEESAIGAVIDQWCARLDACAIRYSVLALDDGSRDGTAAVLAGRHEKWGAKVEWESQANMGHGPTILRGYRRAVAREAEWIFQIDSDGQCDPEFFPQFWEGRESFDFISGRRTRREDGPGRVVVSQVLRGVVWMVSGVNPADANVPYRLMRRAAVAPLVEKIAADCFFTNVGLTVLAMRAGLRCRTIPITFRARQGGKSTVPYWKLGRHALNLYLNLRELLKN